MEEDIFLKQRKLVPLRFIRCQRAGNEIVGRPLLQFVIQRVLGFGFVDDLGGGGQVEYRVRVGRSEGPDGLAEDMVCFAAVSLPFFLCVLPSPPLIW